MYHTFLLLLNILYCYGEIQDNYFKYNNMSTFTTDTKNIISFGDHGRYQKCCPSQFFYDTSKHICVTSEETQKLSRNRVLESGLSYCEVILDQVYSNDHLQQFLQTGENGTITYENSKYTWDRYCLDNTESKDFVLRVCLESDVCDKRDGILCIKKCCPKGEVLFEDESQFGICKPDNNSNGFDLMLQPDLQVPDRFGIRKTDLRQQEEKGCTFMRAEGINYTIDYEGVFLKDRLITWFVLNYYVDTSLYCMEVKVDDDNQYNPAPIMHLCVPNPYVRPVDNDWTTATTHILGFTAFVAGICMVTTVVLYGVQYKMEKVIHMIIFSICLTYVIGFISHIVYKMTTGLIQNFGYWGNFFEQCSNTTWMNAMAFDIWISLRSIKSSKVDLKLRNIKKYLWYSLYGWLLPLIIVSLYYEEAFYRNIMNAVHLERKYLVIVFWVIPNVILTVINLVFYVLTMYHIIEAKNNIRKMKDSARDVDKKKEIVALYTSLTLKLFLLMGLVRSFSIFYSLYHIGDLTKMGVKPFVIKFIEALEDIAIFCVLILKWSMFKSIFRKINKNIKIVTCNWWKRRAEYNLQELSSSTSIQGSYKTPTTGQTPA